MITDEIALQLHDRYSLGEILSPTEQDQLNWWYKQQDQEETAQINFVKPISDEISIKRQIQELLQQIIRSTHQIQTLILENEKIILENAQLIKQINERYESKAA